MISTEDDSPHSTITLAQLRKLVALAEGIAVGSDEGEHTTVDIYEVRGMAAIEGGIVGKVMSHGEFGSGYTEALLDRAGAVLIDYDSERP